MTKLLQDLHIPDTRNAVSAPPSRKDVAYRAILHAIENGLVKDGTVLLEGPIADRLDMSRPPIREALKDLAKEHVIHRFDGRGYLVGHMTTNPEPIRTDLRNVDWLPKQTPQKKPPVADLILSKLQDEIIAIIPFGAYRISEQQLAEDFKVSRTIIRQVLTKLQSQGIVEKDRWSHWIAGPLTAQATRNAYHLRSLLEPDALKSASPSKLFIMEALERIEIASQHIAAIDENQVNKIEQDLHQTMLSPIENKMLAEVLEQSRLPITIGRVFDGYINRMDYSPMLNEHRAILEQILTGETEAACKLLKNHILSAQERAVSFLKVLSVVPLPQHPNYLKPLRSK